MYWIKNELYFPPVESSNEEGILAIGGDLSVERLILAYNSGIFPWFNELDPVIWWSPMQRMVVDPKNYKVKKSLRNLINQQKFKVTFNQNFSEVIRSCKNVSRRNQEGTWITDDMVKSFDKLHKMNIAKSVEVWQENELVGGLYGVDLGHVFCGESMFSKVSNASKIAFVWLIEYLKQNDYLLLDCQIHNDYLESLGAFEISRNTFMQILNSK
jgi:leucyl/phenylalanyl-tRNA--protein transferase